MPKKPKPPTSKPGQRLFRVANLDHATPEHRKQILGNIVDLIDGAEDKEKKEHPPAQQNQSNEKPPT